MAKRKILIIDDDETLCEELGEILTDAGYQVKSVYNGVDGQKEIESTTYDILCLDIKIPGLNGFELLAWLRESPRPLRIVILTGRPLHAEIIKHLDSQLPAEEELLKLAAVVLNKPFNIDLLLAKLAEL